MRSTKSIILIVIALGCGLIASIGISQVMDRPEVSDVPDTETIFVAASNIPSWSTLTPELVKQEEWPIGKIPPDAIRSLDEFDGKSPKYPLYPGEPIVLSKLSDSSGDQASIRIPAGHQVFAVKVDKESALSGLISPGDKVDVLVFIRGRGNSTIKTGTRTILRNTTVFAVNDQIERQGDETSIDAKTVSLLVQPQQSEKLLLAKQMGTIHLALRKPGDDTNMETEGASPADLNGESEGTDGLLASNDSKPKGGIFDILQDMKDGGSTAVDSSNAPQASGPTSSMVIMSPDGVLGTFTFADDSDRGGLPALPTELMSSFEGGEDTSSLEGGSDEGPSVSTEETTSSEDTEVGADDVGIIDPADLGL